MLPSLPLRWSCKKVCKQLYRNACAFALCGAKLANPQFTGSAPEPTETLTSRKTPHLPPKSPGPRHTNIGGSPLRYSSVRPASPGKDEPETETPSRALSVGAQRSPNRLLNFAQNDVYRSIERSPSPRKQSAPLETKVKKPRKSIFEFDLSPQKKSVKVRRDEEDKINEAIDEVSDAVEEIVGNGSAEAKEKDSGETLPGAQDEADAPIMDDYVPQMDESMGDAQDYDQTQAEATELSMAQTAADPTPVKRKRGRPRKSDISTPSSRHALSDAATATPQSATRALHQTQLLDETVASLPHQSPAHAHSHLTNGVSKAPHASKPQDYTLQGIAEEDDDEDREVYRETTTADSRAEPDYIPDQEYESSQPAKKKARTSKAKPAAARKAPRAPSAAPSRNSASLGPDGRKPGPKSIVSLRAGTPQEDEGAATTRSGRVSIKPLKYWCNEGFIWRNGEVDGVVRAQEVEQPKKRAGPKARGRQGRSQSAVPGGLESVREAEEEDEDLWPEQWEEELGVINGKVRAWDAEMGQGSLSTEVAEGEFLSIPTYPYISAGNRGGVGWEFGWGWATWIWDARLDANKCCRRRLRQHLHRRPRRAGLRLPLRQDHDDAVLRQRHGRDPAGRVQTHEEFAQDADGVFRA